MGVVGGARAASPGRPIVCQSLWLEEANEAQGGHLLLVDFALGRRAARSRHDCARLALGQLAGLLDADSARPSHSRHSMTGRRLQFMRMNNT